jgi:hypothetical protein
MDGYYEGKGEAIFFVFSQLSDLFSRMQQKWVGTHVEMMRLFRRDITRSGAVVHAWRQVLAVAHPRMGAPYRGRYSAGRIVLSSKQVIIIA